MRFWKLFRRRLKQCIRCGKTFYKPNKTNDEFEEIYEISPCCNDDFIVVKEEW
jgi:hypothetical protein